MPSKLVTKIITEGKKEEERISLMWTRLLLLDSVYKLNGVDVTHFDHLCDKAQVNRSKWRLIHPLFSVP